MGPAISFIFPVYLGVILVMAAEVVYVTDLAIFTSLAPCASYALSYNIQSQTYSNCPEAVTDLQSCVCTKNQNLASISTAISKSVSYSCGSTASEDQASAATVLSAYCNQNSIPSFPTPATPVSVYVTDVPEISFLARCASYAVSEAVQTLTSDLCPPEATALASCACRKNQNSLKVSQLINSSVKYSCASHTADISSAQAIFAAYCALNNGTSAFPTPTNPPGDMTYYVTALPQYSSLAPCAASALSYAVFSQTYAYCPGGPQALASCACIKESVSGSLTSSISSNVKYSCASTATEDVASAIAVFDFYCSAARAEATAAGVTDSIAQTYPTAAAGNTGGSGSGGRSPTSTKKGGGNSASGSTGGPSSTGAAAGGVVDGAKAKGNGPRPAVIAGAIAGVVVGLAGLGVLIWFLVKHSRKKTADAAALASAHANLYNNGPEDDGRPELAGKPIAGMPPPSPSPSTLKPNPAGPTESVSPVSAHGGSAWTPPPNKAELYGQAAPYPAMPPGATELAVQAPQGPHHAPSPNRPELMGGQGYPLQELPSPNGPAPPAGYHMPPELMGQQGYVQGPHQGQAYPMRAQEYNGYNSSGQQHLQEAHGQPIYEVSGQQGMYQGRPGIGPAPGQQQEQQPTSGWPMAELDGRYGQAR